MAKTENLTKADERRLLKKYLCRYFKAKEKKAVLRDRLENLQRELRRSEGGEASSLAAMEIEARIRRQTDKEEMTSAEAIERLERYRKGAERDERNTYDIKLHNACIKALQERMEREGSGNGI